MTLAMLLREAWIATRTRIVPALMITVLCGSMCATTLVTVGRTASAEAEVLSRLDQAGSRELILGDRLNAGMFSQAVVESIAELSTVERAVGITVALDVRAGHMAEGGPQVPAWGIVGDVGAVVELVAGRMPGPGEALVSTDAMAVLSLDHPLGYVVRGSTEYPVVGSFNAREPFGDLDAGAVYGAAPLDAARSLHVIASSSQAVPETQQLVLSIVAAARPEDLTVQSPASLAELQGEIAGDLGTFGRQLLLLVVGAGAVLSSVVVLTDVLLRRTDLGRRRALGATRRALIALVIVRVLIAALIGVGLGIAGACAALHTWDVTVPPDFIAGTALLTIIAAFLAALPPAVIAATRDPVSVLRTP